MSRPDAITIKGVSDKLSAPTAEEMEQYITQQIAVLDRHSISARFILEGASPDIHYEWHPDDPDTYHRLTSKGFVPNDELAKQSKFVHTDGAGNPRIGDTRLYTIAKWKYDVLQAIENEKVREKQDPRRANDDLHARLRENGLTVTSQDENQLQQISSEKLGSILNELSSKGT